MSDMPRITVIIPTRERCDVLASALRTITTQGYENLRILVSDNFSSDATAEVVARAGDPRITYVNTGKRVSMSHNWEFALSHVEDGWVTFVGDDDGLMPDAVQKVAELIRRTGALAIRSRTCSYAWPAVDGSEFGQLIVPLHAPRVEERSAWEWLGRMMQGRATYFEMPMIYTGGFIHVSLMQEARRRTGAFFRSNSPDVYSAAALCSLADRYLYVHEPLAICGTSRHSTGFSTFSRGPQHSGTPQSLFASEENLPFHPDVPLRADAPVPPPSLQVCVYEAFLQSEVLRTAAVPAQGHAQQLEVILATSGRHRDAIDEWGRRFAALHGIDFGAASRAAARKRWLLQSRFFLRKVLGAMQAVVTRRAPVRNIYDASVAAAVLRARVGRRDTLGFFIDSLRKLRG